MYIFRIFFGIIFLSCSHSTKQNQKLIYSDNFETGLSNWLIEQVEGGTSKINNGRLEIDDESGCTIWFKNKLTGNFIIEYDVMLIGNGGPNDRVSDLNCFWKANDPNSPSDLFSNYRNGKFSNYHFFKLYYVGYGANNNTTTRFRRYPGDGTRPMLAEHDLKDSKYLNIANEKRHVKIICKGNKTSYSVDGQKVFDFTDNEPLADGWFAFRTVKNHMTIDNFKVFELLRK